MKARLRTALFTLVAGVTLFGAVTPAFADEGGDTSPDPAADAAEAAPDEGEAPAAAEDGASVDSDGDAAAVEAEESAEPLEETAPEEAASEDAASEEAAAQTEAPPEAEPTGGGPAAITTGTLSGTSSPTPASRVNPGTATTGTGQTVNIVINSPSPGDDIQPGDTVTVTGQASIGLLGANVNVAYVIDVSGSTSGNAGDCTGDGVNDNILECEKAAAKALNAQLSTVQGVNAGVIQFNNSGTVVQPLTPASDPAVEAAIDGLSISGGTSFDGGLAATNSLFSTASPGDRNIAYFFSDGQSGLATGAGSALQAAIDARIQVNTFSVGVGAAGCDPGSNLRVIADATGGVCIEVSDVSQIVTVIDDLKPAGIDKVEISINGGPPVEADLDLLGNFSLDVTGFVFGENSIVATAFTDDGTEATADVTIDIEDPQAEVLPLVLVAPAAPVAAVSSDDTLPVTGSGTTGTLTATGIGLLLAGLALVAVGRRREVPFLAQFHD